MNSLVAQAPALRRFLDTEINRESRALRRRRVGLALVSVLTALAVLAFVLGHWAVVLGLSLLMGMVHVHATGAERYNYDDDALAIARGLLARIPYDPKTPLTLRLGQRETGQLWFVFGFLSTSRVRVTIELRAAAEGEVATLTLEQHGRAAAVEVQAPGPWTSRGELFVLEGEVHAESLEQLASAGLLAMESKRPSA